MYSHPATRPANIAATSFRKSERCVEHSACVEVAFLGQIVAMRDSKNPDGMLFLTLPAWRGFISELKCGSFDGPSPRP